MKVLLAGAAIGAVLILSACGPEQSATTEATIDDGPSVSVSVDLPSSGSGTVLCGPYSDTGIAEVRVESEDTPIDQSICVEVTEMFDEFVQVTAKGGSSGLANGWYCTGTTDDKVSELGYIARCASDGRIAYLDLV